MNDLSRFACVLDFFFSLKFLMCVRVFFAMVWSKKKKRDYNNDNNKQFRTLKRFIRRFFSIGCVKHCKCYCALSSLCFFLVKQHVLQLCQSVSSFATQDVRPF